VRKVVVAAFIILNLWLSGHCLAQSVGGEVGQFAPDFTLNHIQGSPFRLQDVRGERPIYLVFWSTWCSTCRKEIPRLRKVREVYGNELELIAINSGLAEQPEKVKNFIETYEMSYRNLYDQGSQVTLLYGVVGVPTHFIIDRKGIIIYRGTHLPENLDQIITEMKRK